MNPYEAKQEARRERLEARAQKLRAEGARRIKSAEQIASFIPMGQPILVGHHSEGRHRRDLKRINSGYEKGYEALKAAKDAERRADNIGQNGISSDDSDAVGKLKAKLAALEVRQEQMKSLNAAARKAKVDQPYASYQLSNAGAVIRQVKQRIAQLSKIDREAPPVVRELPGDVRLVESPEDNRLQLFFPGKPAPEVIKALKAHGFRWAPSVGAWQRHLSNGARYAAEQVLKVVA